MIDAEKREKVIWGLEACNRQSYNGSDCQNCPYYEDEDTAELPFGICNIQDMFDDALALLREQEPRVMTLEEVRDSDDWMWIEYLSGYVEWQKQSDIFGCYEDGVMWNDSTFDCNDSYGIEWRCWTSRPTPEQMRDTKWEGEKDA